MFRFIVINCSFVFLKSSFLLIWLNTITKKLRLYTPESVLSGIKISYLRKKLYPIFTAPTFQLEVYHP